MAYIGLVCTFSFHFRCSLLHWPAGKVLSVRLGRFQCRRAFAALNLSCFRVCRAAVCREREGALSHRTDSVMYGKKCRCNSVGNGNRMKGRISEIKTHTTSKSSPGGKVRIHLVTHKLHTMKKMCRNVLWLAMEFINRVCRKNKF